jgi:hypothetical protein
MPLTPKLLSASAPSLSDFAGADLGGRCSHLETATNLLRLLERVSTVFSKCALELLDNQADFDSVIRRSDPSRPNQEQRAELFA